MLAENARCGVPVTTERKFQMALPINREGNRCFENRVARDTLRQRWTATVADALRLFEHEDDDENDYCDWAPNALPCPSKPITLN